MPGRIGIGASGRRARKPLFAAMVGAWIGASCSFTSSLDELSGSPDRDASVDAGQCAVGVDCTGCADCKAWCACVSTGNEVQCIEQCNAASGGGAGGAGAGGAGGVGAGGAGGVGAGGATGGTGASGGAGGTGASTGATGGGGAGGTTGGGGSGGAGGTGAGGGSGGSTTTGCGNGKIEASEHCDDGNTKNLDGCDSACKYEAIVRMTKLAIQGGTGPSSCSFVKNQLGNVALTSIARSSLNQAIQDGINAGTMNVLIQLLGLDDLSGITDSALELGFMASKPDPVKGVWPATGTNPIDWWFRVAAIDVDNVGLPKSRMTNGKLAASALSAGPAAFSMSLVLAGAQGTLSWRDASIRGVTSGAPGVPSPPPGALATGLGVFPELLADQGEDGLCGAITVDSLAKTPVPSALTTGSGACSSTCSGSAKYTYCGDNQPVGPSCNSLLDAIVGGCKVISCLAAINATQPDVPKPGGSLTQLSVQGALNKVPSTATSGNLDAFSAYMKFTARRAHATGVE